MRLPGDRLNPGKGYVLTRAQEAPEHELRHGRGRTVRLLEPDQHAAAAVVSMVTINSGTQPGPFHLHEFANNTYIGIYGSTEIRVADDTIELGPMDVIFIPARVPHSTHNPGDRTTTLLALYDRSVADDFVVIDEG